MSSCEGGEGGIETEVVGDVGESLYGLLWPHLRVGCAVASRCAGR